MSVTLEINGRRVQVDDGFRNLSTEEQQRTVEEIAAQMGAAQPGKGSLEQAAAAGALYSPANVGMFPAGRGVSPRVDVLDPIQGDISGITDAAKAVRGNVIGDDDPTTQTTGEKIGSLLNKAGESLTFGVVGDEASAAAAAAIPGGMGYNDRLAYERQQEELIDQTNPGLSLAADVGGAVGGALLPFGAIGTLGRGAGMGSRMLASGAAGAGMGGTSGFMEGEGAADRIASGQTGAAIGGGVGLVAPMVGGAVQKGADYVAGSRAITRAAKGAPTSEQLRRAGGELYDQIDNAGVQIKGSSFDRMRDTIMDALRRNTAYSPRPGARRSLPNISGAVDDMAEMSTEMSADATSALPFRELDSLRRQFGAANVTNKADMQAGMTAKEVVDDFVRNLRPDDVAAGDVQALQTLLPKARDMWSRMSKSQLIDDAMERSETYLGGVDSGIRNRFASILRSPQLRKGFTEAERAAMKRVINGTIPERLLTLLGGGLGGLGQIGAGYAAGGLPGTLLGMASAGLTKRGSEALAERNAEIVRSLVANGGLNRLPVASDGARKVIEGLMRRTAAAGPQ